MSVKKNLTSRLTRTRLLFPLLLIVLLLPALYWYTTRPKETAAWWNDSWVYRKRIDISNPGGTDLTDFQVSFTLDTTDTNKFQSNCADLRITGVAGNLLPFWIEPTTCNTTNTKIWTKIPSIPSSGTYIYAYYGNPSATSVSETDPTPKVFIQQINDLIGHWNHRIPESYPGSGNTWYDLSGNNYDFTHSSTPSHTQSDGFYFNNNGYFTGPSSSVFPQGSNPRTVLAEAKPTSIPNAYNHVFHYGSTATYQSFGITGRSSNNISSHTWSSGCEKASWTINSFNKIAITGSGNTQEIYKNGSPLGTCSSYTLNTGGANNSQIGTRISPLEHWFGYIKYVQIYTQVLTATEISLIQNNDIYSTEKYPGKTLIRQYATTQPTTSTQSEEIGPGPIAYWKFDEGYGQTANDSTSNNNDGTLGATSGAESSDPTWTPEDRCISGKCLQFDGGDDVVNVTHNTALNSYPITVSAWFKTNTTAQYKSLVNKYVASSFNGYGVFLHQGKLRAFYYTPNGDITDGPTETTATYNDNQWHFVSFTVDNTGGKLYVDGKQESSASWSGSPAVTTTTENVHIGYFPGVGYTPGFIDEVKIYPYARTETQIKEDFNMGAAKLGQADQTFLSDGLVGYWKMDDAVWTNDCTARSAVDSSGNGNGAKICAASTGATQSNGKFGNSASLDGYNDYLEIPNSTPLQNPINNQWSLSAWIKPTTTTGLQNIIRKDTSGGGYFIRINAGSLQSLIGYSGGYSTKTGGTIAAGSWQHITMTYDGTTRKHYINGVLAQQWQETLVPLFNTSVIRIGTNDPSTEQFAGNIDEARIYNRALSADEVAQLYNWAPGPVGYWNFDEGEGTTAYDKSGNGNNGTLTGGPTWGLGKKGKSVVLDGNNDYVLAGDPAVGSFTQSQGTVGFWMKKNSTAEKVIVMNKNTYPETVGIELYTTVSNGICLRGSGPTTFCTSGNIFTTGEWAYVSTVFSGTNASIYVNGTLRQTGTIESVNASTYPMYIGRYGAGGYNFDGSFDDVRIYNYTRTQEQILQDMQGTANAGVSGGPVLPDPIAHYSFDEQQGQTAHNKSIGGSSLDGTLGANSSPGSDDPTWKTKVDCKVNGCLSFDGGDYINISNDNSVQINEGSLTAWVKTTNAGSGYRGIIVKHGAYGMFLGGVSCSDNTLTTYDWSGANNRCSGSNSLADNQWHHIAFTFQSGITNGSHFYIDGKYISSTTITISSQSKGVSIGTGDYPYNTQFFNGLIDEVKIYNSALSAEQIKQDMNAGSTLAVGTTTSEAADLSDGAGNPPILEWKLDEKTGTTTNDTSGNENNGTVNGATWNSAARCHQGACLEFDGSSNYVDGFSTENMSAFTAEAWVKTTDTSLQNIFSGGNAGWYISISGGVVSWYDGNSWRYGTTNVSDGQWHHLVYVFDNGAHYMWVDGQLEYNNDAGNGTYSSGTITRLGAITYNARYLNGSIDHVKIYNYARTPAQIAYDYNRGEPIAHWKMDECQGSTIHDTSNNSNHGTLTVTTTGGNTNGIGTCTTSTSAWGTGSSGKFGASLNFDGTDDYVDLGSPSYVNSLQVPMTITGWFRQNSSTGYQPILAQYKSTTQHKLIKMVRIDNGNLKYFTSTSTGGFQQQGTFTPTVGQWHFFAIVTSGTLSSPNLSIYLNNSRLNYSLGTLSSSPDTSTKIYIGGDEAVTNERFNGQLDDIRIYNYALSETQVKKIMNEGSALRFGD